MSNEQIAHDLAIAKLHCSDLDSKELIAKYKEYYEEIKNVLDSESKPCGEAIAMQRTF